jgi:peptide/nickel transport system substrate-binding protein
MENTDSEWDRRRFLKMMGAGALSASVAGCSSGNESYSDGTTTGPNGGTTEDSSGTETETEGSEAEDLGTAVYSYTQTMTKYDPSTNFDGTSLVLSNVYEPLLWYNTEGNQELHPGLATDYEVSEDGLAWTYNLREGVQFHHDYGEMTAEDVVFSIERTMELGQGAAWIWAAVDAVEAVDDYTVEFTLNNRVPLDLITASQYGAWIFSKKGAHEKGESFEAQKEWFENGNDLGTGPYTITDWQQSSSVTVSKFDDYWGGWEKKHFSEGKIAIVTEPSTYVEMLKGGDADILGRAPFPRLSELENNEDIEIAVEDSYQQLYGMMNVRKDGTDDVNVRRAIRHVFPYEQAIKEIRSGYGEQAQGVVPSNMWGHDSDLPTPDTDVEKAEEYLEQSDYSAEELSLTITYTSGNSTERRTALILQNNLEQIGVDLTVEKYPWSTQWERAKSVETAPNIFMFYWWPTYITPYDYLYSMFHCVEDTPNFNLTWWCNEDFDSLINEAHSQASTDRDAAVEKFKQAQQMIESDALSINFWRLNRIHPKRTSLKGYQPNPAYPNVVFFYDLYR